MNIIAARIVAGISLATFAGHLLAVDILVNTSNDGAASSALCQLRDAIIAANTNAATDGCVAGSGTDRILFASDVTYILLQSALPLITSDLEIRGPGRDQLVIDGDDTYGIFDAGSPGTNFFTLRNLTLTQGSHANGGCVRVFVDERVIIEDVKLEACTATQSAGAILATSGASNARYEFRRLLVQGNVAPFGAGIQVSSDQSEVIVEDVMFLNNRTTGTQGTAAGLYLSLNSNVLISRSSFVLNEAANIGSALSIVNAQTTVRLEHSTITQNVITAGINSLSGGALFVSGQLTMFNSVVANNTEQSDDHDVRDILLRTSTGGVIISEGYNFIGSNQGSASAFPAGTSPNGDRAGTHAAPLDADLAALADNGGPYMTVAPEGTSPLIDKGSCPGETTDQRGYQNPLTELRIVDDASLPNWDDACDVGAIEFKAGPPQLVFADGFEDAD